MNKLIDLTDIDSLTPVELPDRNLLDGCVAFCFFEIQIDAFNNWTLFSYNDIQTAVNNCQQFGGDITQMGYQDPTNYIDPSNAQTVTNTPLLIASGNGDASSIFDTSNFTDTSSISDPNTIVQDAMMYQDNSLTCVANNSIGTDQSTW
jgi:hypothetical protein